MKRWLPWIALAACARPPAGGDERAAAGVPVVGAPVAEPRVVAAAPDLPYARSPLPVAPHTIAAIVDGAIAELAAPADGGYAVTLDTRGGVLVWPALDGKHEPVVVATRIGAKVATLRDGDAIAIAVVDKLGQLELVRVSREGRPLAHEDIAAPRPIVQVVATTQRLIALRDDQIVAVFDAKGALVGELEAARGERIAQLVARDDHVVAVSASRRGKHTARALDLRAASLAWAPATKRFESDDDGLALSPDGKHLLGSVGHHSHAVKIDLARGTSEEIDDSIREIPNSQFAIGFRDARTAIFLADGKAFVRGDDGYSVIADAYTQVVTFTAGPAIGGVGGPYLVVIDHDRARYLGYRAGSLADVLPSSDGGWLATDGGSLFHLDGSLRLDKRIKTPFPDRPGWDRSVALLDERHAIVSEDSKRFVYAIGADHGELIAGPGYAGVEIQHSTGLAILPGTPSPRLARWNADKGSFADDIDLTGAGYLGFMRLYDPAATGGMIAMFVDDAEPSDREGMQKITFHELYGPVSKPRLRDHYEYVDNAELFSGHSGPNLDALVPIAAVRATSSDRTLIAELANNRITMFDHDGNVRWARTANGARGLVWNRDDDLIAFGDGIARIVLDTGEYTDQQCGWDFGLWDAPPQTATTPGMCVLP